MEWPPRDLKYISPMLEMWGAWFSGDPGQLVRYYSRPQVRNRESQFRGGVVGYLARTWWGQPVVDSSRIKLHMPLAADIAQANADLLFSEEIALTYEGNGDRLNEILDENSWQSLLPEAAELCAAYGGAYLRVSWDLEVAGVPLIGVMNPEGVWPQFRNGRLQRVTFWNTVNDDQNVVQRLLETHTVGRIDYGLYQGTPDQLGRRIPFADSHHTEYLSDLVDSGSGQDTGIDELAVVYVPNVKPNRALLKDPVGKNLGRADISGTEPFLDALDETWSSWMRDIRLGKSRIIVPTEMMKPQGAGNPYTFNYEQELYVPMNTGIMLDQPLSNQITSQQFAIRTAEHEATIKSLISTVAQGAGYSAQTFGLHGEAAATATEVNSRDRRTIGTREKKTRYWTDALETLLRVVQLIDQQVFNQGSPLDVQVSFPASGAQSADELAKTIQLLDTAKAVSLETKVRMAHPDWEEQDLLDEIDRIREDEKASSPQSLLDFMPPDQSMTPDEEVDPDASANLPPRKQSGAMEAARDVRGG